MAYDVNIDYKAKQNELKKQMEATTDATQKAQLQAQYDAYEQSRNEKIASDINTYGKYATDAQLNSAAGIAAQNQIGTTYETQKQQLTDYYAQSKQNANNDALSRGMARSSYVSDRLSGLDSDLASGLSSLDSERASAVENARASILDNYRTNAANTAATQQSDARDQISTILDTGGAVGDSLWTNSGYDASTIAALKNYAAQQAAGTTSSGSGGTGGTGGTEGDIYDNLYSAGVTSQERAYAWLITQGFNSTEATTLADNYSFMYNNGDFNPEPAPSQSVGYTQLGSFAQTLLGQGKQSGASASEMANLISGALAQGKITEAEADLIISSFGY